MSVLSKQNISLKTSCYWVTPSAVRLILFIIIDVLWKGNKTSKKKLVQFNRHLCVVMFSHFRQTCVFSRLLCLFMRCSFSCAVGGGSLYSVCFTRKNLNQAAFLYWTGLLSVFWVQIFLVGLTWYWKSKNRFSCFTSIWVIFILSDWITTWAKMMSLRFRLEYGAADTAALNLYRLCMARVGTAPEGINVELC